MIKTFLYKKLFRILLLSLIVMGKSVSAQTNNQMLLFQVDGNTYSKKNYNKESKLLQTQLIKVGKFKKEKEKYFIQIDLYDIENKKKVDSAFTKYYCNPKEKEILMNIVPFIEVSSNQTIKINLVKGNKLYPNQYYVGQQIDDVEFTLDIEGGTLVFFGANSKIKIFDRKVSTFNKYNNTYTIISKIEVKAYMLGLRIDTIMFNVLEHVSLKKGIVYQKIIEDNGDYYIIKFIS